MSDRLSDQRTLDRIRELQARRREIMALPSDEALARILSDPQPAALVHAFPESDFYILVHEIGPEDALPVLALASDRQWDHLVDLEGWARDRMEVTGATRWMNLLMEADPRRFVRWFLNERSGFGELYLFHTVEVRMREHDQDPSEFGEGFFTFDDVYYLRLLKLPPGPEESAMGEAEHHTFLMKLLERLAEHDHPRFQNLVTESSSVIPAESEEDEYRWRNVRLAEKGIAPFDEAIGIYQPVAPEALRRRAPEAPPAGASRPASTLPVPAYPLREMPEDTPFSRALARVESPAALPGLQMEFANLCNRIIVADHRTIRDREQLRPVVAKACGYLSLGLEQLKGRDETTVDPSKAAAFLLRHPLADLFRLGFGTALQLKWGAERWLAASWFAKAGLRLTFWGEQWMGVLGGVLLKKPLYYDNYRTGVLYREFASPDDLAQTEGVLREVQAVDRLLGILDPPAPAAGRPAGLTWKSLVLTRWARHRLGLATDALQPLAVKAFRPFFDSLFGSAAAGAAEPRRIPDSVKADFLAWLSEETGLKDHELSAMLGGVFEDLFRELETEYGRVAAKDMDPRFVQLFLLTSE
jgi:hypothetical protein